LLDGFVLLSVGLKLSGADWTPAGLWLAVVASGLYHGVSPGMGWPLAVSAGLMERSSRALVAALLPLSVGHLLAMLLVILPFALLVTLVEWQRQIQIGASLLVIGFGIFRLVNRLHPRVLARIRPTQLGLWSFVVAIAHGAGLMLVPIYLGLCRTAELDRGHEAAVALINANLGMAVLVSVVHSVAMIAAGGFLAWLVYRYLGLKFVSRSWFNLDATWALSLILVGALSLVISLASGTEPHLSSRLAPGAHVERTSTLFAGVPDQRCTVHKHCNLLSYTPERPHDEISVLATVPQGRRQRCDLLQVAEAVAQSPPL
jgi:hypothetical protein